MTKPSIYLFRYHGNEHMDPHFSLCFLTWYGISFKKNLGSLNYYGPKKSFVNVASLLKKGGLEIEFYNAAFGKYED